MNHFKTAAIALSAFTVFSSAHALAQPQPLPAEPLPAEPAQAAPDAGAAKIATPAMWRVADEDSEFILLGTIHFLPPSLEWRNPVVTSAFESADIIYFEANPDDATDLAEVGNLIRMEGANPPGVKLSSMLEISDANKLREISQELQLSFAQIDPLRPWNAFLALTLQLLNSQGFDPGSGVDRALVSEAKIMGKDIRYFETMSEQIGFFTQLDPKTERDMLVITIRNWDDERDSMNDLVEAWAAGDTTYVDTSLNEEMREKVPAAFNVLIADRNAAWAETLDAELKEHSGKAMVAVGAAHLVGGEFSVPALLKAKGYEVSRYGAEDAPDAANDNAPGE